MCAWLGAGPRTPRVGVLAPAYLPCVWESSVLHNDPVSQAWDKGDWGTAGKGWRHMQQLEGFRPQQWCPACEAAVTLCADGNTGLREAPPALGRPAGLAPPCSANLTQATSAVRREAGLMRRQNVPGLPVISPSASGGHWLGSQGGSQALSQDAAATGRTQGLPEHRIPGTPCQPVPIHVAPRQPAGMLTRGLAEDSGELPPPHPAQRKAGQLCRCPRSVRVHH